MKKQWTGTLAIVGALALGMLLSFMPAAGQGGGGGAKGGKGGGGGGGGFTGFAKGGKKGGPTTRTPDGKPDMNGFWETRNFFTAYDLEEHKEAAFGVPAGRGVVVDPANGKIPYQPWAQAKKEDMVAHHLFEDPQAHCYLSGVPRQMYTPFGFQIIQTPTAVVLMYEAFHANRIIYLTGKHPGPAVKMFEGDSRGRWEGDTLVVDVTNQNDRTWFDMEANFHSPDVHVVERFTPVLDDSNTIHYEATIEDPKVFTRPWKIAFDLGRNANPGYENLEYACVEGEQDLQHYTDGAGAAGHK